jgi:hypothetical protein
VFDTVLKNISECDLTEKNIGTPINAKGNKFTIPLKPHQMRTLAVDLAYSAELGEAEISPGVDPPPPNFSPYWLHDRHEAPTGNAPQSLIFKERPVALSGHGKASVNLVVSNSVVDVPFKGTVELIRPKDFACEPSELHVSLPPSGFKQFEINLQGAGDLNVTRWFWAMMDDINENKIFDIVPIGSPEPGDFPVEVSFDEGTFAINCGEDTEIKLTVKNNADDLMPVHIEIIGPVETWEWFHSDEFGFYILKPGQEKDIHFLLRPGADIIPGNHFIFLKIMAGDKSRFSEVIDLWRLDDENAYLVEGSRELVPGGRCIVEAEFVSADKLSKEEPAWRLEFPIPHRVEEISKEQSGDGIHKARLKLGVQVDAYPGKEEFPAKLYLSASGVGFDLPLEFVAGPYAEVGRVPAIGMVNEFMQWMDTLTPLGMLTEGNMRGLRGYDVNDLGAEPFLGWQPEGLFVGCRLRDSIHDNEHTGDELWRGDCLVVSFAKPGMQIKGDETDEVAEYAFALARHSLNVNCFFNYIAGTNMAKTRKPVDIQAHVERIGPETIYKVFIPADAFGVDALKVGDLIRFNLAVHDADMQGWKGAAEWAKGSVLKKDPTGYGAIKLVE